MRKWWLLATSLLFYGWWKIECVPLLLFSIGFNYAIAEGINRWRGKPAARVAVISGVAINLLLLGYFKYTNFILDAFGRASGHTFARLDIALPLAISFFTFTQIGYLVDVYRDQRPHYRPLDYSVFVVFFQHLIAGPIVWHWEIIPQFADKKLKANRTDMAAGVSMFLLGLFKRCCSRDPASRFADVVYGAAEAGTALTWFDAWLGTIGFPLSPSGFRAIREFCVWAKTNDIRVLATFPNLCHRPEYDAPEAKRMPAQFHEFYGSLGVPVLGEVSESMLPEEQMFDTNYHPLRTAAIARTQRLLVHLAPHLRVR